MILGEAITAQDIISRGLRASKWMMYTQASRFQQHRHIAAPERSSTDVVFLPDRERAVPLPIQSRGIDAIQLRNLPTCT